MTPWERVEQKLHEKRLTWTNLADHLEAKKQAVGNWKSRGIPAKYFSQIDTYFNEYPGWTEFGELAARSSKVDAWPFEDVIFERWDRLTERQKGRVETAMNAELDRIEAEKKQANGTNR